MGGHLNLVFANEIQFHLTRNPVPAHYQDQPVYDV